jgi:hypothetical protein
VCGIWAVKSQDTRTKDQGNTNLQCSKYQTRVWSVGSLKKPAGVFKGQSNLRSKLLHMMVFYHPLGGLVLGISSPNNA